MAYVIATGCCNDATCVDVCPVDAIRPRPEDPEFHTVEQLYIDPHTCIDCSACMFACPVSAVHDIHELPEHLSEFAALNAAFFEASPLDFRYRESEVAPEPAKPQGRIAVVGAGPAACYAIAELLELSDVRITVFDRSPTPFGLLRSGVAPDHPHTKQIDSIFQSILENPRVDCYFNVEVGRDVDLEELRRSHHGVVVAAGAGGDRSLGIEGESLPGSHSAREFVSWYNGHPDFADNRYDLSHETAVVIGNGNVALDVARSLLAPIAVLETTDMADHAIAALRDSAVRTVIITARRGPADAACSTPELLELMQDPDIEIFSYSEEGNDSTRLDSDHRPHLRRKREVFDGLPKASPAAEHSGKRIIFRFGMEPVEIRGDRRARSVDYRETGTHGPATESIDCGLVIRAVGFKVPPFPGVPLDEQSGTVSNLRGRVVTTATRQAVVGVFVVGWAKRGPSGSIGTNKVCSRETVAAVLDDLVSGRLPEPEQPFDDLDRTIRERTHSIVDLRGWNRIDAEERRRGRTSVPPRARRKIVHVSRMLDIAGQSDRRPEAIGDCVTETAHPDTDRNESK